MTSIFVAVFSKLPKNIFRNSSKAEKTHRKLSKVAKTLAARQKKVRFSRQKVRFYVFSKTFVAQKRSSLHAANDRHHQNPCRKKYDFRVKSTFSKRSPLAVNKHGRRSKTIIAPRFKSIAVGGGGPIFAPKLAEKSPVFAPTQKVALSFQNFSRASSKLVFRISKLDEAGS